MKNIDYYINKIKNEAIYGGNEQTKAYPFVEDGVILVNKGEKNFEELKKRIKKCKSLGINIPEYFDYKITHDSEYWILEELAPGEQLANLINNDNGQNIVNDIPYEHIEKYINDVYLLNLNGIAIEPRRRNIFYDKKKGFTTIDVATYNNSEEQDSLEEAGYFFNMYSNILLINFSKDQYGENIKQKTYLNMIKAFENGCPFFKKYSRWIYRSNDDYANVLKKIGYDLSLDDKEYNELISLINKLIDDIVKEKINKPEKLFWNTKNNIISLLSSSINYCTQFNLFDSKNQTLEKYIEFNVYNKIKILFLNNQNDNILKELYSNIRRKELNPIGIYPTEYIYKQIEEEIRQINHSKLKSDREHI